MAFTVVSCKVTGAPTEVASRMVSGSYAVEYTVEVSRDYSGSGGAYIGYVGPKSVLAACQSIGNITPDLQPVPRRWARYDYTWLIGSRDIEVDHGSWCKDWIVQPTNERRTHWTITALFSRLQPGEIPNVDELGNEITNPINWYPRYYLRKFVLGEQLDAGWPRDPIAGDGFPANASTTEVYGPFKRNDVVKEPQKHPLDEENERFFKGIDAPNAIDADPITRANLLSPTTFPTIKREYGLLHVRMNWPTMESFWLADQKQKYTVWNGGDDWAGNTDNVNALGLQSYPNGRKFFTCRWGQAKYEGGGIIGDPQVDNGIGYYIGEFRYQLLFDRDAEVRVRNDSTIDVSGLPIQTGTEPNTGNPVYADEPQWLDLEGNWLGAAITNAGERQANWIRWWYGGGYDYAVVTNGGIVAKKSGGTQPIQVGMFLKGVDYAFPTEFPYPSTILGDTAFVKFPP